MMPVSAATEMLVPNVPAGVYFARVRGVNANGQGAPSNVVQFVVGVPEPPQLTAVQVATNPVTLSWSAAPGATRYVLSAGTAPGKSDIAVVPMGTATSVTGDLAPGAQYYVRVAAINDQGAVRSNEISFVVGQAGPAAAAPPIR
jgi:predicted phage tail protein